MTQNEGFISYDMKIPEKYELIEITSVENIGKKHTWDIEVPIVHAFNAKHKSGLESVSHNSAMISLFSHDDEEMLLSKGNFPVEVINVEQLTTINGHSEFDVTIKYKNRNHQVTIGQWELDQIRKTGTIPWYKLEEQRGRANNSVMLLRSEISQNYFKDLMIKVENSKAGEPGVYWTNDLELLTNPCCEISLDASGGFCNLTEVNVSELASEKDLLQRVKDATFLGTLQAGYTDFHYLGHQWREIAERDSLLGVSMTGIGSGQVLNYDLKKASEAAIIENVRVAAAIGINPAKRIGTIKPSGCLVPETKVKTTKGELSLQELFDMNGTEISKDNIGFHDMLEEISVYDEFNNIQPITKLYVNGVAETYQVEMGDGYIFEGTGNHKVKTSNRGWIELQDLHEGDDIVSY